MRAMNKLSLVQPTPCLPLAFYARSLLPVFVNSWEEPAQLKESASSLIARLQPVAHNALARTTATPGTVSCGV